jgi:tRNA dimethylallyltransferase
VSGPSTLCCIVGPTAAGKSALAMALAERHGLAIVSADSRQVYRGFDIGTAKPSAAERACVPHYGLDVVDPTERYSAARWAEAAAGWLADATRAGTPPVVVGGTGLYLRALVQPLDAVPPLDQARRATLEPWLSALSTDELARWCRRLDPARAHLGRTQLLRAVETALLAGERLSSALGQAGVPARLVRYLVVDPGPVLAVRIERRVHAMLASGFLDEVARLRQSLPPDAPAWNASGYGVLREHLEGSRSRDEAVTRVIIETRQYAKRQRTWFRHQVPAAQVTRVDPSSPDALAVAEAWYREARSSTKGDAG